MFYEIVVAPGYTPEGLEVLKGKSKVSPRTCPDLLQT
jgi:AICAR transformylase/IMP cyclohydrolase PurH